MCVSPINQSVNQSINSSVRSVVVAFLAFGPCYKIMAIKIIYNYSLYYDFDNILIFYKKELESMEWQSGT